MRRLVLASSMVVYGEGRYACPEHGVGRPAAARRSPRWRRATSRTTAPTAARRSAGSWSTSPPGSTRAAPTPPSKVAQEHYASAWARQADGAGGRAEVPQRLRARACRGTRRTPASPRSSAPRSSAARRRGSSRTAARCATSCTSSDVARANVAALQAVVRAGDRVTSAAYNVCSGTPGLDPRRRPPRRPRHADRVEPVVTGEYRPGDVRHVVASPRTAQRSWGSRRRSAPTTACRRSRPRPSPTHAAASELTHVCDRCHRSTVVKLDDLLDLRPPRSPAGGEQVLHQQRDARPGAPSPRRRHDSGSSAQPISSQGTNGSQIRSTSARLICERSATTTIADAAEAPATSTTRVRGGRPARQRVRDAGEGERPGAEGEGGEVAPHPVRRRAVVRDALPVAVVQHGQRVPPGSSRTARRPARPRGRRARRVRAGATTAPATSTATASSPSRGRP